MPSSEDLKRANVGAELITELQDTLRFVQKTGATVGVVKIDSEERERTAGNVVRLIRERTKELEAKRKEITGPLNQAKRAVDALFKPTTDQLTSLERQLRDAMADYQRRLREEHARALAAAEQAARKDDAPAVEAALEKVQESAPRKTSGLSYREEWEWEIVDFAAVPDEYKALDQSAVRIATRGKEAPNIPGLKFTKKLVPTVR